MNYGMVLTDKTGGAGHAFRCDPNISSYMGATPDYAIFNGFPWADLQLMAAGSDSTPNP